MSKDKKQPAPASQAPKGKAPERPVNKGEGAKAEDAEILITRGKGRPVLGTERPVKPVVHGKSFVGLGEPPPDHDGDDEG